MIRRVKSSVFSLCSANAGLDAPAVAKVYGVAGIATPLQQESSTSVELFFWFCWRSRSRKKDMPRPAKRRGESASQRGLSREQIPGPDCVARYVSRYACNSTLR